MGAKFSRRNFRRVRQPTKSRVELRIVDGNAFFFGDRLEDQLFVHAALGIGAHLFPEFGFRILLGHFSNPRLFHLTPKTVDQRMKFAIDQRFGKFGRIFRYEFIQDFFSSLRFGLFFLLDLQIVRDPLSERGESFERSY